MEILNKYQGAFMQVMNRLINNIVTIVTLLLVTIVTLPASKVTSNKSNKDYGDNTVLLP